MIDMSPSVPLERSGPSVRAVLAELAPEDLAEFEAEFRCALAEADDDFDLDRVQAVINRWWPRAYLRIHPPTAEERAVVARVAAGDFTGLYTRTATAGWAAIAPSDEKSQELQQEIDRLSEALGVRSMPVGLRTNDGLNVYVADDDGTYHFTFYERGKLGFDRVGVLDDVLYWYCEDIVSSQASKYVGDRKQRFLYVFEVLSQFDPGWAKRGVRETAAAFSNAEDIALLPDIGEPL